KTSEFQLETRRLKIRQLLLQDLDTFIKYRNDPIVAQYQDWEPDFTIESATKYIKNYGENQEQIPKPGKWCQFFLIEKSKKVQIGDIGFHLNDEGNQAEFGITLDREFQHLGYAKEALLGIFRWVFKVLKLHRITAICDIENIASRNLLEKIGMRLEGKFEENVWFKGKWGSEFSFALLQREWISKKEYH
ncbi:MAG: GNAT family N-acetyltransferase, partial [Promethearchaeota archaeon]